MVETNIRVTNIEALVGKSGKSYYKVTTPLGIANCFAEMYATLYEAWQSGTEVMVDWIEKDGFLNIKKAKVGATPQKIPETIVTPGVPAAPQGIPAPVPITTRDHKFDKDPVGLAVEIFVNLGERFRVDMKLNDPKDLMNLSIDLVKQAQEAFN